MRIVLVCWAMVGAAWALVAAKPKAPAVGWTQAYKVPTARSRVRVAWGDSAGHTTTVCEGIAEAGTLLLFTQPAPLPVPPPPVPPTVIQGVVEFDGSEVFAKPSGWIMFLKGSGFPTTGIRRLDVCGRTAPVSVWTPTLLTFTVPPGPPDASAAVTGSMAIFVKEGDAWLLRGRGGTFTILPTAPGARRR